MGQKRLCNAALASDGYPLAELYSAQSTWPPFERSPATSTVMDPVGGATAEDREEARRASVKTAAATTIRCIRSFIALLFLLAATCPQGSTLDRRER